MIVEDRAPSVLFSPTRPPWPLSIEHNAHLNANLLRDALQILASVDYRHYFLVYEEVLVHFVAELYATQCYNRVAVTLSVMCLRRRW